MHTGFTWKNISHYKKHFRVAAILFVVTIIATFVFLPYVPTNIRLIPNEVSELTIVSSRYLEFETIKDQEKTIALRKRRASLVEKVYTINEEINKDIKADSISLFTEIRIYQQTNQLKEMSILSKFNPNERKQLQSLDIKALDVLENLTSEIIEKMLAHGIRDVDKKDIQVRVHDELESLHLNTQTEALISQLVEFLIKPNLSPNDLLTQKAQEREMRHIKPILSVIKEGETILYKGEIIQDTHIETLKALKLHGQKTNFFKYAGIWILCASLAWILIQFLVIFSPKTLHAKYLLFIAMITLIISVSSFLFQKADFLPQLFNPSFLIPLPVAALLLSQMISPNIALMISTQLGLLIGLMYFGDIYLTIFYFCSSCVSTFSIHKRHSRSQLMLAGYVIGGAHMIFILVYGLLKEIADPWWFLANMGSGLFSGILSAMTVLAIIPYLEALFKITTPQTLLELANLNSPLLKRLMMSAPGTYQHSLMVANLAEAAAEAIHANPILCRVGAYYHDIGKIKRPHFFTENQFSGENPHDTLNPRMSKMLIVAHTRDGLELAEKYKLPSILKDFIAEHHGTSLVSFFFEKAIKLEDIQDPEREKQAFRYPGPKPHFKEAGVVMFADSVEAAVRSMEKPTLPKIEHMIEKIFHDKIEDNQMDDCPLSLREIDIIKATFLRMFHGIYHTRLNYQEEIDAIIKQTKSKK
jgi:cyclic-di-AMP phosphodiesterase PgpH